jgi:hypothetical protein
LSACAQAQKTEPSPIPTTTPTPHKTWQQIQETLDHFKVWTIAEKPFTKTVTLLGQFNKGVATNATLTHAVWILNPVEKNGSKMVHPESHLVAYFLEPPRAPLKRWVTFKNQINTTATTWSLGDPAILLLPASKVLSGTPPAPPANIDHFECYLALDPKPFAKTLTLIDQFDTLRHDKEKVTQLEPAFFCVPVSKNGGRMVDDQAHLVFYDITPHTSSGEQPIKAVTQDQFNLLEVAVSESIMLGVPTEKVAWGIGAKPTPTPKPTVNP